MDDLGMKQLTTLSGDGFIWSREHERVWVTPWGRNGVRVRVTREAEFLDLPQGLMPDPLTPGGSRVAVGESEVSLIHGEVTVSLAGPLGQLTFQRSSDGATVLKERTKTTAEHLARTFTRRNGSWKIEQRFFADDAEKLYGLGQRQHGYLNQKGCIMDLMHRNSEVSIPFMISNKGYGFLWNSPCVGQVALGRNDTRWTAEVAHQIDYYIVIDDSPAALLTDPAI